MALAQMVAPVAKIVAGVLVIFALLENLAYGVLEDGMLEGGRSPVDDGHRTSRLREKNLPTKAKQKHRHGRFHLVRGTWQKQKTGFPVWRDSGLCSEKLTPHGCPYKGSYLSNSTRSLLNNKWIYFYGDSTMRQLASAFFNEFMLQNVTYKEAKAAARECPPQKGRQRFSPLPWDGAPCDMNEKICEEKLELGAMAVRWTEDWKHFIYEDYDEWLFSRTFKGLRDSGKNLPDVLVTSTGMHSCFHYEGPEWLPMNLRKADDFLDLLLTTPYRPKAVILLDAGVHLSRDFDMGSSPESSRCAMEVNSHLRSRLYELVVREGQGHPWLSFVSRQNITMGAPFEMWRDMRRMHLEVPAQEVLLSYLLFEIGAALRDGA